MTNDPPDPTAVARLWVEFFSAPAGERRPEIAKDASWYELPRDAPDFCLAVIIQAVRELPSDPANRSFQALAAGPLEDLLGAHGPGIIERVEAEARRSPAFNLLLGGVWKNAMSNDVWARVEKARLKVW